MRIHGLVVAVALVATGCPRAETSLRLTIEPGAVPAPAALRLTLTGATAAPFTVAPVTLPGTVVIHGLPASASSLCVHVEALDGGGALVGAASATAMLTAHAAARATATLVDPADDSACAPPGGDDLAVPTGDDLAGLPPGADLLTTPTADLATVVTCPPSAFFCDDFESADLSQWTYPGQVKVADMGSVARSMTQHAHGAWSLEATASGSSGADNYANVEKLFAPMTPPLAMRANIYSTQPLGSFTMVMSFFDASDNAISIGGDSASTWVVTEDNSGGTTDHHSDMATTGGAWHCLEVVIDATGNITAYVDNKALIGPFPRALVTSYTSYTVGIVRAAVPNVHVFVDDVAVGTSRLYCP